MENKKLLVKDIIKKKVTVNRKRSPQEALKATGRNQYVIGSVVAEMPKGKGKEVEVFFFSPNRSVVNGDELKKEFDLLELKPADPYSLSAVNEADPTFARKYPNATYWKDKNDKWCFAAFIECFGDGDYQDVVVDGYDHPWDASWWFAGLRK